MTLNRAGQVVVLAQACDGASASILKPPVRPACLITNPDSNKTCSPDGRHIAATDGRQQPHLITTVYASATGQVEAVISWLHSDTGIGGFGGPLTTIRITHG